MTKMRESTFKIFKTVTSSGAKRLLYMTMQPAAVVISLAQSPMFRGRSTAHKSRKISRSWRKQLAGWQLYIEMSNLNQAWLPGNTGRLIQEGDPKESEGFCIHIIGQKNGETKQFGRARVYHLTEVFRQDAHLLADIWLVNAFRGKDVHRLLVMLRLMVLWCQEIHPANMFLATPPASPKFIARGKTWGFVDTPLDKLVAGPRALQRRAARSQCRELPSGMLNFSNDRIWQVLRAVAQMCMTNVLTLDGLQPIEIGPMLASHIDLMRARVKEVGYDDNIVA